MNLSTRYMGLTLAHPLVASASPVSQTLDGIRSLEDHGAAAIVLFSLFEEQIAHELAAMEQALGLGSGHAEATPYFAPVDDHDVGPSQYLELIRRASEAVDIPIIASLNGTTVHGWTNFAALMQDAGAKGLELNIYAIPTEMSRTAAEVEHQYLEIVTRVKAVVSIPVAVKLGPYFSAFANMATRLDGAGADALVLFNRFYQPDFDIETRTVVPSLSLSRPDEIRLPLLWLSLLHGRLQASLAATTGVHGGVETIKYLMAGADVVMSTSAVLHQGPVFFRRALATLTEWMERKGYTSVDQLRGSMSRQSMRGSTAFVRANYIRTLESFRPLPGSVRHSPAATPDE